MDLTVSLKYIENEIFYLPLLPVYSYCEFRL